MALTRAMLSALLALPFLAGCLYLPWGTGGTVLVEAYSVSDDFRSPDARGANAYPTPQQLAPLGHVVVVPYFEHRGLLTIEVREALRLRGQGDRVYYPLRLYLAACTMLSLNIDSTECALVFAEGCWPADIYEGSAPAPGCHWRKHFAKDEQRPAGADQLLHVVLYRQTRAFDHDVLDHTYGYSLTDILVTHLDALFRSVDHSSSMRPEDRTMVYTQLLTLVEGWLVHGHYREPRQVCEKVRDRLRDKVKALSSAPKPPGP